MTPLAVRLDDRIVSRCRHLALAASIVVMLVGGLAFAGWVFDVELLKGFHAAITMKANAAIALFLSGAALALLYLPRQSARVGRIGQLCGMLAGLIGAATLSQHLFGWNLGIDQLLFSEAPGAAATTSPGRMGPPASTCFGLAGIALVLLHGGRAVVVAQTAAAAIGLIALLAITGYMYSVESLYGVARYTGIAVHTALALFVLGLGILAASADRGFAAIIAGQGAGSVMTRRMLTFAVLVPLLLGWIRLQAEIAGYFDPRSAVAALMLSIVLILTVLTVRTGFRLNKVEQQQLAAEAELRDRLNEMETMMEVLPVGLFIATDRTATHITANRAAREFLRMPEFSENVSLSAPAGEAPAHFRVLSNGVELAPEELPVQRAARDGVAIHNVELDVVFSDGVVRHELISALPLFDAEGEARGAIASLMDVTAQRAARQEREDLLAREREARAQAESANRAKDEFLAVISHELRTPLTAILGWASMLQDGTVLDPETMKLALVTIERSCRAQAQLVEDLLDVSRIRAGTVRLDMTPVDMVSIVHAAADLVRPAADSRGVELRMLLDQGATVVFGDAARLQQIVWNLLTNAVKFNAKGGLIEVRLAADDADAVLTVTDTGEGIDPVFLPFVFDRFRQGDEGKTRRHGGLGLGLSIAQHLVEMHHGTIEAASAGIGKGACFTVRLPLALAAEVIAPGPIRQSRPAAPPLA